jgi:hypothetical protein
VTRRGRRSDTCINIVEYTHIKNINVEDEAEEA